MIAMTTSSSISVNPRRRMGFLSRLSNGEMTRPDTRARALAACPRDERHRPALFLPARGQALSRSRIRLDRRVPYPGGRCTRIFPRRSPRRETFGGSAPRRTKPTRPRTQVRRPAPRIRRPHYRVGTSPGGRMNRRRCRCLLFLFCHSSENFTRKFQGIREARLNGQDSLKRKDLRRPPAGSTQTVFRQRLVAMSGSFPDRFLRKLPGSPARRDQGPSPGSPTGSPALVIEGRKPRTLADGGPGPPRAVSGRS